MVLADQTRSVDGQLRPWAIGVGACKRRANIFQVEPIVIQNRGIDIHANGRQRAAAHKNLPDAFHLREFLLQDGRGQRRTFARYQRIAT